jgi:hypothetical protein
MGPLVLKRLYLDLCVLMLTNVYQCLPMFAKVYQSLPMHTNFSQCLSMFTIDLNEKLM